MWIIRTLSRNYTLFSSTYLSIFKSFRNVNIPLPPRRPPPIIVIIYDIYYIRRRRRRRRDDDVFIVIVIYNIYTLQSMAVSDRNNIFFVYYHHHLVRRLDRIYKWAVGFECSAYCYLCASTYDINISFSAGIQNMLLYKLSLHIILYNNK